MSHFERSRAAPGGGASLQAVLFDLMRTLVVSRGTYGEQLAYVYRVVGGVSVDPEHALAVTEAVRLRTVRTDNPEEDWARMNQEILAILAAVPMEQIPREVAAQVRPRLMGDPSIYQVLPEMRALLDWLVTRLPLGLASNYEGQTVDRLLDHFDLRRYLRPEWIFVSDRIGGPGRFVDKPMPEFWQTVRATVGCPDEPCAVALIGDDWRTDAPAVQFGHPVVLLDCSPQQSKNPLAKHPLLFVCRSLRDVERALLRIGLPR